MIVLPDQTYIVNETVLCASDMTDIVAQSAPNLVQGKQHDSSVILKHADFVFQAWEPVLCYDWSTSQLW